LGFEVLNNVPDAGYSYFIGIGDNQARKQLFDTIGDSNLITVISPRSHRGSHSIVKTGCFIGNYCHLGPQSVIDQNTIINTAAIIEHEVMIGKHCHIGPNATISGRSKIGDLTFIGAGATVKDYISICSNAIIGAGATVVHDIDMPGIYIGTPARRLK
jgi:sugar O-acyltransferase (sialic acid O-acetyltransferase NeuD family)